MVLTETKFTITTSFNSNIDFCFWVLERECLVMDDPLWQSWLSTVVATQDQRLNWGYFFANL